MEQPPRLPGDHRSDAEREEDLMEGAVEAFIFFLGRGNWRKVNEAAEAAFELNHARLLRSR